MYICSKSYHFYIFLLIGVIIGLHPMGYYLPGINHLCILIRFPHYRAPFLDIN